MTDHERLQRRTRNHRGTQVPRGDDVGDGRIAEQCRDLAEKIASAERPVVLAVDADGCLALEDQIEPRSGQALTEHAFAGGEAAFLDDMRDRLELAGREIAEQREAREHVRQLGSGRRHSRCLGGGRALGNSATASGQSIAVPTPLPSGTLTFVFTDIEGSTKLLSALGTQRFHDVLAVHTTTLRRAFADGGTEIRIEGDALFVVFASAAKAVRAAAEAQRALLQATFPHDAVVRVRMGMHTGEGTPASKEAGADYVGIDVHRAARIAAVAHGGQVLASAAPVMLAGQDLGAGITLRDLGEHRLKDLAQPERIYQLVIDGCVNEFPPLRSLDRTPNNLPTQVST